MFKLKGILFSLFSLLGAGLVFHLLYMNSLQAKEIYPDDNFLTTEQNKTALVIVAHDDDAISCAGTMSMLCSQGWKIRESCFYSGWSGPERDSIRKKSFAHAAQIEGLTGIDMHDIKYRNDYATNDEPWKAMSLQLFKDVYDIDTMYAIIGNYIETYKPSVIITLDDSIGGYGHPDHLLVSKLVREYCNSRKDIPGFPVKKIYQAVFPPSLADNILGDGYRDAKKIYGCNGMPEPDVQVKITAWSQQKKSVMEEYTTEQNSIKKIWPYYNFYPASLYFKIFDREFFHVIPVKE